MPNLTECTTLTIAVRPWISTMTLSLDTDVEQPSLNQADGHVSVETYSQAINKKKLRVSPLALL